MDCSEAALELNPGDMDAPDDARDDGKMCGPLLKGSRGERIGCVLGESWDFFISFLKTGGLRREAAAAKRKGIRLGAILLFKPKHAVRDIHLFQSRHFIRGEFYC